MKLSELKSSPDVGRPERTFPICVSGKLVAELEAADRLLFDIESELAAAESAAERQREGDGPPTRLGAKSPVVALEKKAEAAAAASDAIRARMKDHTILLHLAGKTNGEWRQWVTKNPARDEETDPADAARDLRNAGGFCNIDALIAALGDYVTAYGDEPSTEGSWAFVETNAAPGDLTHLASVIVGLHEQPVDTGKSRAAWRLARQSVTDSA